MSFLLEGGGGGGGKATRRRRNVFFFLFPSLFLVLLLLVLTFASTTSEGKLEMRVSLDEPAGLSTSYSPRKIQVRLQIFFHSESVFHGGDKATVWLPPQTYSKAQAAFLSKTDWSNIGVWGANKMITLTLWSVVQHYSKTERDAFLGLQHLHIRFPGASERCWVIGVSSRVLFTKLAHKLTDTTVRNWDSAKTLCKNNDAFLTGGLKPYEQTLVQSKMTTGSQWWLGGEAQDARPSMSYFCWKQEPDYDSSLCKSGGYYTIYSLANNNVNTCARQSGYGCPTFATDWDSTSAGIGVFTARWVYSASAWTVLDRERHHTFITNCWVQENYGTKFPTNTYIVNGSTPSQSYTLTRTDTLTLTRTSSLSSTSSRSVSFSSSLTSSKSLSHTFTDTGTFTVSLSKSGSLSPTFSTSLSFSKTQTLTFSRSLSNTRSPTLSRSSSLSRPPTPTRTFSKTGTLTGKTPTFSENETSSVSRNTATLSGSNETSLSLSLVETVSNSLVASPSASDPANTQTHNGTETREVTETRPRTATQTILIPKAKPVPALQTVQEVASVVALASGAGFVAVQQARLKAAMSLSTCGTGAGLYEDMEVLSNPLQISFGIPLLKSQRGAAFGNIYVLGMFLAFMLMIAGVVCLYSRYTGGGRSFKSAVFRTRLPGVLILPLAILTPGTAEATAALFLHSTIFNDKSLAVFACITIVVGPLLLIAIVVTPSMCKAKLHKLPEEISAGEITVDVVEVAQDDFLVVDVIGADNDSDNSGNSGNSSGNDSSISQQKKKEKQQQQQGGNNDELEEHLLPPSSVSASGNDNNNNTQEEEEGEKGEETEEERKKRKLMKKVAEVQERNKEEKKKAKRGIIKRALVATWRYLLVPEYDWFDQDLPPPDVPREHASIRGDEGERGLWTMKYGVVFEDFRSSSFALADLGVSTLLGWCAGAASGYMSRAACLMWLTTAVVCAFYHFIALARGVCLVRIQAWFYTSASFVTAVVTLLAMLSFLGTIFDFVFVASFLSEVNTIFGVLVAVVEIIGVFVFFAEVYDAWQSGDARVRTRKHGLDDSDSDHDGSAGHGTKNFNLEAILDDLMKDQDDGEEIDLSILLNTEEKTEEEPIDLSEFLNSDNKEEEEEEMIEIEIPDPEPEPEKPKEPEYALEEGEMNEDELAKLYQLDDGDDDGLTEEERAAKKAIGSAQRANQEQFEQLASMLGSKESETAASSSSATAAASGGSVRQRKRGNAVNFGGIS